MSIRFRFHPEKAVEAAAILLKLHGKPMKHLGLLKMLYIADRIALGRMEQPITGDCYVSMNYGPVLSSVYDLIKGQPVDSALPLCLNSFLPVIIIVFPLLSDPGVENLCEAEIDIIKEVYGIFGQIDPFEVAQWTHDLPEWQNPNGSRIPIAVEDVLKYMGKSAEEITEIQRETEREAYLDEALHG